MHNYNEDHLVKIEDGETGEIKFYALIHVGGIDETGKYEIVFDGEDRGEKIYE